ncbi:hypothetical protein M0804_003881 [Polistes exclamans]|nr:hypothetical protein M0804_003881 [Polistes exclamans]
MKRKRFGTLCVYFLLGKFLHSEWIRWFNGSTHQPTIQPTYEPMNQQQYSTTVKYSIRIYSQWHTTNYDGSSISSIEEGTPSDL